MTRRLIFGSAFVITMSSLVTGCQFDVVVETPATGQATPSTAGFPETPTPGQATPYAAGFPSDVPPGWIYWNITAITWHDQNSNGIMEAGEPRIGYVRVVVDDEIVTSTDAEGVTSVSLLVGTPEGARLSDTFFISADPPEGYDHTTPARLEVPGATDMEPILFGLRYDPTLPLPTPRPQIALECREYPGLRQESGGIGTVDTLSDGTVLATLSTNNGTRNQIYRFDFQQEKWLKELDPTDFNIHWLYGPSTSDLWAAGYPTAIYHFDGRVWSANTNNLGPGKYGDLVIDRSGTVLVANNGRYLYYLRPQSDDWEHVPTREMPDLGWVYTLDVAEDGSIWSTGSSIVHLVPSAGSESGYEAEVFDLPPLPDDLDYFIADSALSADGSLWIVRSHKTITSGLVDRFFRFDTRRGTLEEYTYESTGGAKSPLPFYSISLAPDGSLWANVHPDPVTLGSDRWPLLHLIPGSTQGEHQWVLHEDDSLPRHGLVETVDLNGGVWLSGQDEERQLIRCEER